MGAQLGDLATWAGAVVAIGGAAVSVVYAKRSAGSAAESAKADQEMAHHQRTPEFTAVVEDVNGDQQGKGGFHRLALQLTKPAALDRVEVALLSRGVTFPASQNGVDVSGPQTTAVHAHDRQVAAPLAVGERAYWRVDFEGIQAGSDKVPSLAEIELRVTARIDGVPTWDVLVTAPVDAVRKSREWRKAMQEMRHRVR